MEELRTGPRDRQLLEKALRKINAKTLDFAEASEFHPQLVRLLSTRALGGRPEEATAGTWLNTRLSGFNQIERARTKKPPLR
jgi:hypothetical protein